MESAEGPLKTRLVHYDKIVDIRFIPADNLWAIYFNYNVLLVKDPSGFKPGDRVKVIHEKEERADANPS